MGSTFRRNSSPHGHPFAFRAQVATNARGEFQFVLPYGDYEIRADSAPTVPLTSTLCTLRI